MIPTSADAYDLLPDGVVLADADGDVLVVNEVARRMLGPAARPGVPLREAMTLQDREGNAWFATVGPYRGLSTRRAIPEQAWFTEDGTELLVHTRIRRTGRGGPVDHVAVALRSARGRERLDRERSDLVATVAHELRSPLTGVKGFVGTLLNKWDRLNDEQKRLMLTTAHSDAERLSRLITELLDVARIDTGRLPLYPREFEIGPCVERILSSVRAGTSRTVLHTDEDPQATVFADPDKFIQVVTNLVENAIRHGEGEVRVATRPLTEPVRGVEILVDDEGDGIPEGIRTRVFTKFWKSGVSGGSGLGMYIVNGLTRVHGGTVEILDGPRGGARVRVLWPTAPADDEGPADESGSRAGRPAS
ncbi:sensor histidine kinase [Nocardioides terrisoli]|uniref:sensor histidine kinase n=1 Tax=Nocardioides terrisoli TaxID=3388267 RepID=UPI00287B8C1E|nr:ATP-binding protein [Nocardioides marmorisolisilvae]